MTLPNVTLGNTESDIGQGANTFASGLLAQRQRQQQLALQEALAAATQAHMESQSNLANAQAQAIPAHTAMETAQTGDINAQAAGRQSENLPADDEDEAGLRVIEPHAPRGIFQGKTKAQAAEFTKTLAAMKASQLRINSINDRFDQRGQITTDANGNEYIVRPNLPGGGTPEQIGGQNGTPQMGKPLNTTERQWAGAGGAAMSAHQDLMRLERDPNIRQEVAKAISLPNFGRLTVVLGHNYGETVAHILDNFRLAGASPEAQEYLKRMFDFAGIVGPKRYGLRGMQSPTTLQQLWTDFGLGQFDLSDQGVQMAEKNRENAVRQLQTTAGPRAAGQAQDNFSQPSEVPTTHKSKYGYER